MIRKLLLALVALVLVLPVSAFARDGADDSRHERFHHRTFVYSYPFQSTCYWQPGYWVNQLYYDGAGGYVYVPQWVPAQYVCY